MTLKAKFTSNLTSNAKLGSFSLGFTFSLPIYADKNLD